MGENVSARRLFLAELQGGCHISCVMVSNPGTAEDDLEEHL